MRPPPAWNCTRAGRSSSSEDRPRPRRRPIRATARRRGAPPPTTARAPPRPRPVPRTRRPRRGRPRPRSDDGGHAPGHRALPQQLLVERERAVDEPPDENRSRRRASRAPIPRAARDRRRASASRPPARHVPRRDQQAGLAVHDLVRDPARARGHHGQAVGHRFQGHQARALVARRVHEDSPRARTARAARRRPRARPGARRAVEMTGDRGGAAPLRPSPAAHDHPHPARGQRLRGRAARPGRRARRRSPCRPRGGRPTGAAARRAPRAGQRAFRHARAASAGVSARDLVGIDAVRQHDHLVRGTTQQPRDVVARRLVGGHHAVGEARRLAGEGAQPREGEALQRRAPCAPPCPGGS